MQKFYVPYKKNAPAIVTINGHSVLVITTDEEALEESLTLEAEDVLEVDMYEDIEERPESIIEGLPKDIFEKSKKNRLSEQLSVVVAPPEIDVDSLLNSLKDELVWIQ